MTTFIDGTTIIYSSWLNSIDNLLNVVFSGAATPSAALTAINGLSVSTAAATYAPKASPVFTGTPSLPTGTTGVLQAHSDSSTKLATTSFVQQELGYYAPLVSPTFTGTPSLPTGTIGVTQTNTDNTTKIATTAFVQSVASGSGYLPLAQTTNIQCTQTTATTTTNTGTANLFNIVIVDDLSEMSFPGGVPTFTPTYAGTYLVTLQLTYTANTSSNPVTSTIQVYNSSVNIQTWPLAETVAYASNGSAMITMSAGWKLTFQAATATAASWVPTANHGILPGYFPCRLSIVRVK